MPKLIIDGKEIEAENGMTLLQACDPLTSSCPGLTRASFVPALRHGDDGGRKDCRIKSGNDGFVDVEESPYA